MSNKKKKTWAERLGAPMNSGVGLVLGVVVMGGSGFWAVRLTNPDKGQTVTVAEVRTAVQEEAERIKNDPHMPPQAKEMALRYLGHGMQAPPPPAPYSH